MTASWRIKIAAGWLCVAAACWSGRALAQPANDNCTNTVALTIGTPVTANNTTATDDAASMTTCTIGALNQAMWYRVIGNGHTLTASTCSASTNFDTQIQVWCGLCGNLACVAGNDYDLELCPGALRSIVSWCSEPGRTYLIAVGGWRDAAGQFQLVVNDGPPCADPLACAVGDTCATAQTILAVPFDQTVNNSSATGGLPTGGDGCNRPSATVMAKDVWWKYTPSENCTLIVTIDSVGYDGITALHRGPNCGSLTQVECLAGSDPNRFQIEATAGTTYWIQTGDYFSDVGVGGPTRIRLNCFTEFPTGACCDDVGACTIQTQADCQAMFNLYAGDGTTCVPNICPQIPENDVCTSAFRLELSPGGSTTASGDTFLANDEETTDCGVTAAPGRSVWFKVTGTGNTITATTCSENTNFDTILQVFCDCTVEQCVGGNNDSPDGNPACDIDGFPNGKLTASWCSLAGQNYYIQLGGDFFLFGYLAGNYELTVSDNGAACAGARQCPETVGNDDCPAAMQISSLPFSHEVDSTDADPSEPPGACNIVGATEMLNDLWYTWLPAAPCAATLTITTDYDANVAVYTGPDCAHLTEDESLCVDDPQPIVVNFAAQAGTRYWFQVGRWGYFSGGGSTRVELTCAEGAAGACCLPTGTCVSTSEVDCESRDGVYQGDDSDCMGLQCPQPGTGAACATPSIVATNSTLRVLNHRGWFGFQATGMATSIETCGSGFDTVMQVLGEDCQTLLAENDDCNLSSSFGGGSDPNASCFVASMTGETDSCLCLRTQPGTHYRIRVGRFNSNAPPTDPPAINEIVLTLTDKQACRSCNTCPGDVDGNGERNGGDVAAFLNCLTAAAGGAPTAGCGCADLSTPRDNVVNTDDVQPLANALIADDAACP